MNQEYEEYTDKLAEMVWNKELGFEEACILAQKKKDEIEAREKEGGKTIYV